MANNGRRPLTLTLQEVEHALKLDWVAALTGESDRFEFVRHPYSLFGGNS
jgi:hypothetical protein